MLMKSIDETQISAEGIGRILNSMKLSVPAYQRSYSWDKSNVEQFFKDVISAYNEGAPEYFLGSIVLIRGAEGRYDIVDGQQRLATTSILIAVIKDYFQKHQESARAEAVQHAYLFSSDVVTMSQQQHLVMNASDNNFFQALIEDTNIKLPKSSTKYTKNLLAAAQLAREQVYALEKISTDPIVNLAKLVVYLQNNVKTICVVVPDEANAFAIFETLNDRGLALSIADLLKNFLFGKSDARIDEAKEKWSTLVGILSTVGDETILPTFIRHFWASYYEPTTEKELFGKIKTKIHSANEAIDLIDLLILNAKNYAALLNPEHEKWIRSGAAARETIKVLNDIKLEQPRPLFLAVISNFSEREAIKALKKAVDWSVRISIAGNTRSGQFAKTLSDISIEISTKKINNTKSLSTQIIKLLPSNDEFVEEFSKIKPNRQMARYYLTEFEKYKRVKSGRGKGLVPSYSTDEVNLEHILPITVAASDWPNFDDETARSNFSMLGNLTLMYSKENSKIGNLPFDVKKASYGHSAFIITNELNSYDEWSSAAILQRQDEMANLARVIWPQ